MTLCLERVFRNGVTDDCWKLVGKVPVVKERLIMVVIIGRMVDETCFKRQVAYLERHE